jgi:sucrose phosphorylase
MDDPKYFHWLEPDYTRPVYQLAPALKKRIRDRIAFLYGEEDIDGLMQETERLLQVYHAHKSEQMIRWETSFDPAHRFTEKDVILITYGDLIRSPYQKPLQTLAEICKTYFRDAFNTLHILPFFPYSSDRGFAVMDFEQVDPQLGTWEDILALKQDFKLMFDGVLNHVSSKSRWFQEFLNQNPEYIDFFTVFSTRSQISPDHLKLIIRPRTSDLLSEFNTLHGTRLVWSTFSKDQLDLNYKNPRVMLKMIEILLFYIRWGADMIRLDAVTYLWEELGTTSAHLVQTHESIKLFRDILNAVAPHVALITETNVPHKDNIKYFGDGYDEAQMVYNFALPPLVLHAFQNKSSRKLSEWASGLKYISPEATFFNFLDSHDGIGVMAVQGILSAEEIERMALKVLEHGGYISYKANGDGSESPYELNITWYSAINREDSNEPAGIKVRRYLASRSIALVLQGVPGIYLHGLLGSHNDAEAVLEEGTTRSINRRTIRKKELITALDDRGSNLSRVSSGLLKLIRLRIAEPAFHPNARQQIFFVSDTLFVVQRTDPGSDVKILCLTDISGRTQEVTLDKARFGWSEDGLYEIIEKKSYRFTHGKLTLECRPYDILWLKGK